MTPKDLLIVCFPLTVYGAGAVLLIGLFVRMM